MSKEQKQSHTKRKGGVAIIKAKFALAYFSTAIKLTQTHSLSELHFPRATFPLAANAFRDGLPNPIHFAASKQKARKKARILQGLMIDLRVGELSPTEPRGGILLGQKDIQKE